MQSAMTSNATQTILDESEEDQRPRQQSLRGVLRREGNWKCLLLTLATSGCLAAAAWCQLARVERVVINFAVYPIRRTQQASACEAGYAYLPAALALLLYLVYLVECYHSTARVQLARRVDVAAVARRVRAMRDAAPRVWWKAVCYHYVRRKRQVTRYRNGDAYTTTQVYYERVNTHSASTSFAHACCGHRDASRNLMLDARPPITKVRFSKGFAFANIEAASEFEDQRSRFFAEHERFDDFMEMREGLDLVGVSSFKEYMVAYRDADNVPWYSSQLLFWVLSCLLLSWPLRIVVECNTAYVHYTVTKIFGTNYELDASRRLDLETHLSDFTPPVTTSNYGWVNGNASLNNDRTAIMANSNATSSSGSQDSSTQQINILALAARSRSNVDPGVMSHTSTIDSLELFATIRENCALVPSYSEALRIDRMLETGEEEQVMSSYTSVSNEANASVVNNGLDERKQGCIPEKPNKNRRQCRQVENHLERVNDNVISERLVGSTSQNKDTNNDIVTHRDMCNEQDELSTCDKRPILEKSLKTSSIQCTKQSAIIRNKKRFLENVIGSNLNKNNYTLMHSTLFNNYSTCSSNNNHINNCNGSNGALSGSKSRIRPASAREASIHKQNRYSWNGVVTNCKTENMVADLIPSKAINKSNPTLSMMSNSSTERLVCANWNESTGVQHAIIHEDSLLVQNLHAIEENVYKANGISESIDRNLADCSEITETVSHQNLIYASPLIEVYPDDPFGGRNKTTPTEDPPPYEVAIHLPVLRRITRSITDRGELFGQSRAFITDTILNRRSCIDSIVSKPDGVRLLQSTIAEQNQYRVDNESKL